MTNKQRGIIGQGGGNPGAVSGSGTEYTEGDTDASITGTAILWEDAANTLATISAANPLPIKTPQGSIDTFAHLMTAQSNNQIDVQFYRDTPANLVDVTSSAGGSASASGGTATFSTSTNSNGNSKGVTAQTTIYHSGAEMYALFTAAWPTGGGSAGSFQRIGLYDDNDGFFIGYEGTTFGVTVRKGGSDTQTAKSSFSEDDLTGGASSRFTRAGSPEAIDLTKLNVFRVRFGWLGSAPIEFEILGPDDNWVLFHEIKQPNLSATASIENADLPVTAHVDNNGANSTDLQILSNCWGAGTTLAQGKISDDLSTEALATLNRSVIAGETTAGGGGLVNVKVNPSGALEVEAQLAALTTPIEGEKDVAAAATPEALASTTAIKKVDIVAKSDNTGTVWVKSSSTQNQQGRPLFAAQGYTVETDDLANIFLEVTVNGEGVTFLAYV